MAAPRRSKGRYGSGDPAGAVGHARRGEAGRHNTGLDNTGLGDNAPADPSRRRAALGLAGVVGLVGAGTIVAKMLPDDARSVPNAMGTGAPATAAQAEKLGTATIPRPQTGVPQSVTPVQPAAAGAYADRDASYAAAVKVKPAVAPAAVAPSIPAAPAKLVYSGPNAAAQGTKGITSAVLAADRPELHLLRRTTFGPRPADVAAVTQQGIDAWLSDQLDPKKADPSGDAAWANYPLAAKSAAELRPLLDGKWDAMYEYAQGTLARQAWSERQLFEVVVDVLANHLNVTMPHEAVWDVGPSYHNEVIRAHAFGRFEDMLLAAMKHPAMLNYLNNDQSRKESVNENLGRELLELHTVGIDGGYTETDVRNSAYILTGRTVNREPGTFKYDPGIHYTGPVAVLGFTHPNDSAAGGLDVGEAYVKYLANHPATANHVARKFAVRFVADDPNQALVDRLAKSYLDNGTAILPVLLTLFSSTEFWASVGRKTRRPAENVVASLRAVGVTPGPDAKGTKDSVADIYRRLEVVGNQPLAWAPPNGYPDVAGAWVSAGSLLSIWSEHRNVVQGMWKGLSIPKPETLVGAVPATAGEYVDELCRRLTGQSFAAPARAALLSFTGVAAEAPVGDALLTMVPHLAPLVLDSAYFALR